MTRDETIRKVSDDAQRTAGYRGKPFPQTHPDRLATVARLHGVPAAPPDGCRVLELGCGDGGNLIPMAFEARGSTFVGVDLDATRVAEGQQTILELGLENVQLFQRDLTEVGDEYGKFDYVIAHGVYCWVPPSVQDRLLSLCRSVLEDGGVAFVSFNVMPGWHFLEYMRDFALLVAEQEEGAAGDPLRRVRSLAQVFAEGRGGPSAQAQHLKVLFDQLRGSSDYLLAFDYLGEVSQPLSLGDFVEAASHRGLRYIADANFFETELNRVPARVRSALNEQVSDPLAREKLADFFGARLFRRALMCKAEQPISPPSASAVREHRIVARVTSLSPDDDPSKPTPASFSMLHQTKISLSSPIVKRAISLLGEAWPQSLNFTDLTDGVVEASEGTTRAEVEQVLTEAIWQLYEAGAVDLRSTATRCVKRGGARPGASLLSRVRLGDSSETVNQHHELVRVPDALSRALFVLLDGTRDRPELASALGTAIQAGTAAPSPAERYDDLPSLVEQRLEAWAAQALLIS